MPSDDYSAASGGALKIKGVKGSKIDKHKKKKKKPKPENEDLGEAALSKTEQDSAAQRKATGTENDRLDDLLADEDGKLENLEVQQGSTKTEAERRFEENRRKKVSDLLYHQPT